jgi:hypothetical protein
LTQSLLAELWAKFNFQEHDLMMELMPLIRFIERRASSCCAS